MCYVLCDTKRNFMTSCYTISEFAKLMKLHPVTIRRAIKAGRIHAFRAGRGKKSPWRIPETEIERIMLMSYDETVKHLESKDE